jgi:hypothetical protein
MSSKNFSTSLSVPSMFNFNTVHCPLPWIFHEMVDDLSENSI